jgi:hypothetical protein
MAKHRKTEDYNQKPFDPTLEPTQKAREFDEQYAQNNNKARGSVEQRKGKHRK